MTGECRDAKAKFQMFDSLLHTSQETKDGRKRAVMTSSMPFRDHFVLEEDEPSQIYPHGSGKGPQLMLPLASVAGLVVARMEAELEDGRVHVVPLALFPGGMSSVSFRERKDSSCQGVKYRHLPRLPALEYGMRSDPPLVVFAS